MPLSSPPGIPRPSAPSAYTQTYSTANRTVPNATAVAPAATAATNVTPYGFGTAAQADAIKNGVINAITDIDSLRKVVTALIDDLQAAGLIA